MSEVGDKPRVKVESPAPDARSGGVFGGVALLTLDRPEVLNALDYRTLQELVEALERLDTDEAVRCVVITGAGEKAFAAGADIKEMADATPVSLGKVNSFARWERIRRIRLPLIAAVRGYALGGGCELAMACDMVVAADDAVFGQPEIKIGIMPGAGGTQRLTRALGKARAMELILTGANLPAREAYQRGLVSRLAAREETLGAALDLAREVAAMPPLAVRAAKEAVNRAFELSLEAGLEFERRNFFLLFASDDQKEGMAAFVEKRKPGWNGR
ncbi:MAG TPA: enoyl-CoA hydratase-related protein [Candidatus Limnocylindria bacterium]|nr:enoyl-CoA hydratase-related protein [Candidatus Limnocylindria bacterium]